MNKNESNSHMAESEEIKQSVNENYETEIQLSNDEGIQSLAESLVSKNRESRLSQHIINSDLKDWSFNVSLIFILQLDLYMNLANYSL